MYFINKQRYIYSQVKSITYCTRIKVTAQVNIFIGSSNKFFSFSDFIIAFYSGGEQEYLAFQYPNPKQLISFVFLILIGVIGRGAGLAQVFYLKVYIDALFIQLLT
jgi:hypothetical protein